MLGCRGGTGHLLRPVCPGCSGGHRDHPGAHMEPMGITLGAMGVTPGPTRVGSPWAPWGAHGEPLGITLLAGEALQTPHQRHLQAPLAGATCAKITSLQWA